MIELTPAMNEALDRIVTIEYGREDIGDLLQKYRVLLGQLDDEGLYDIDDMRMINEDTKTLDELLRLEKQFDTPRTLLGIDDIRCDPPIQICSNVAYDTQRRIVEIILFAPIQKYVNEDRERLLALVDMSLIHDRPPGRESRLLSETRAALEWLMTGLYRRKYGDRVRKAVFNIDRDA